MNEIRLLLQILHVQAQQTDLLEKILTAVSGNALSASDAAALTAISKQTDALLTEAKVLQAQTIPPKPKGT